MVKFRERPPGLSNHVLTVLVFPVLGAHPGASESAPGLGICFHGPLGKFLDLLPPASLPPVQKRDAQHMFLQHKGSHTEKLRFDLDAPKPTQNPEIPKKHRVYTNFSEKFMRAFACHMNKERRRHVAKFSEIIVTCCKLLSPARGAGARDGCFFGFLGLFQVLRPQSPQHPQDRNNKTWQDPTRRTGSRRRLSTSKARPTLHHPILRHNHRTTEGNAQDSQGLRILSGDIRLPPGSLQRSPHLTRKDGFGDGFFEPYFPVPNEDGFFSAENSTVSERRPRTIF